MEMLASAKIVSSMTIPPNEMERGELRSVKYVERRNIQIALDLLQRLRFCEP